MTYQYDPESEQLAPIYTESLWSNWIQDAARSHEDPWEAIEGKCASLSMRIENGFRQLRPLFDDLSAVENEFLALDREHMIAAQEERKMRFSLRDEASSPAQIKLRIAKFRANRQEKFLAAEHARAKMDQLLQRIDEEFGWIFAESSERLAGES